MEPTYKKYEPEPQWEYHHMTWEIFLTLRCWAQEVADIEKNPVYIVGSSLYKPYPRDIDLSIIMPISEFEERFGTLPDNADELKLYLDREEYWSTFMKYRMSAQERILNAFRVDVKIQPDTWFTNRDRILLAIPDGDVRGIWGKI